ncbi:MAG: sensor histidine kinase [Ferruginibacter sp.]
MYLKKCLLLLTAVVLLQNAFGQTLKFSKDDGLMQELKSAKEDTNKVLLLIKIGNNLEQNNPDSAGYYYSLAGNLSKKLQYLRGTFKYISNITAVLNIQSKFDSSLALNLQSIDIAKKLNDSHYLGIAYNNTGGSYYNIKNFEKCIEYFLKAVTVFEQSKENGSVGLLYANLSGIYSDMDFNKKAYDYGLKAIAVAQQIEDTAILKEGFNNTSTALLGLRKFDSALLLSNKAIALSDLTNDNWTKTACLIDNCEIYFKTQRFSLMSGAADEALLAAQSIGSAEGSAQANLFKSLFYLNQKSYEQAKIFAQKGVAIAKDKHINDALRDGYKNLSLVEFGLGNMSSFYNYSALSDSVENIILSNKIIKNTLELDAKYSLGKKQIEIDNLAKEKKIQQLELAQKKQTIYWLIGSLILLFAIAFFYYRYSQQKKILQQQKITELENEKLLTATQAIVQGQEEERTRLAKDLHDGLGGILSSTKYSLGNMKQNLIITPENAAAFERTMDMLDQSIKELRRVAHNMMPETLMKLSLSEALQDYCMQVTQSGALKVSYQNFGTEDLTLENSTKITVYRIIQELINNAIKHANAQTADVQLIYNENKLNITVEDDGNGFDKTLLENASGIGYKNLQSRVDFLKGTIDIQSQLKKGTSVYIEIPLA